MVSLVHPERRSWLLILLTLLVAQDSKAAVAILGIRQSGKGRGGDDGDSDSDSDDDNESCSKGVCVFCRRGVCTTSTQGSNQASQTRSAPALTSNTGAPTSSSTHSAPSSSGTTTNSNANNNKSGHKRLNTGGIVGFVIGLLILSGLLIMFLMRRHAHKRHKQQKPRVSMLIPRGTPSDAPSLDSGSGGAGSEMVESAHSPGVVSSAAGAIAAANLAAMPRSGYPAPEPYKPSNAEAGGSIVPVAQLKANGEGRQDIPIPFIEGETRTPGTSRLLPPGPLVSPHEQSLVNPFDAAAAVASSSDNTERQSRELPNVPPSTTHAEMIAFQKELERDSEKDGQLVGGRNVDLSDPPPTYSDR